MNSISRLKQKQMEIVTDSTKQKPSSGADNFSGSQYITNILRTPNTDYCVHKTPSVQSSQTLYSFLRFLLLLYFHLLLGLIIPNVVVQ
jgi:hypothetical protein